MVAASWHTQVKHVILTRHMYQPGFMFMGKQGLQMLPRGFGRERAMSGILALCRQANGETRKVEAEIIDGLRRSVSVEEPTPELLDGLRTAVRPLRDEWLKTASPEERRLFSAAVRTIERLRHRRHRRSVGTSADPPSIVLVLVLVLVRKA